MKLIYKGKFIGEDTLPVREHPAGAVQFKEPESMKKLALIANGIALVLVIIALVLAFWRAGLIWPVPMLVGCLLSLLTMVPHEFLHAICFKEEVYLYQNLKQGLMFVISTEDMSKSRFVFLSMLPNVVFGFIPFIIFMIEPSLQVLGMLGALAISMGAGDYLNVFNCLTQVPKGGVTYMSGLHSFWYMPGACGDVPGAIDIEETSKMVEKLDKTFNDDK